MKFKIVSVIIFSITAGFVFLNGYDITGSDKIVNIEEERIAFEKLVKEKMELTADEIVSRANTVTSNQNLEKELSASDKITVRALGIALIRLNETDLAIEVISFIRNYSIVYNDLILLSEANEILGRIYQSKLQLDVAEFYLKQAFELFMELGEMSRLGNVAASRAYNMVQRGLYEDAIDVLNIVYPLYLDLTDFSVLSAIEGTKSMIFNRLSNEERSFYYANRALQNAKKSGDEIRLMGLYSNFGILFRSINPDSSLYYYRIAEKMATELKNEDAKLRNRINIGNIYIDQGEIQKAFDLFTELEHKAVELNNQQGILLTRFAIAKLQAMAGEYDLSDVLIAEVFNEMDEQSLVTLKLSSMEEMIKIYEMMGKNEYRNRLVSEVEVIKNVVKKEEIAFKITQASLMRSILDIDAEISILKGKMIKKTFWTNIWIVITVLLFISNVLSTYVYITRIHKLQSDNEMQIEKIKKKFTARNSAELKELLRYIMEVDKLFMNNELKVEDVCEIAKVNRATLIEAIQESGWSGFNEYVNNYRVEEMKRLLIHPEKKHYSLDYLHKEAGFGSKQSFYKNFKEIVKMTPAKWREKHQSGKLSKRLAG